MFVGSSPLGRGRKEKKSSLLAGIMGHTMMLGNVKCSQKKKNETAKDDTVV